MSESLPIHSFFFFNDTATTEIYTLSLHDALPISHLLRDLLVRVALDIVEPYHRTRGLAQPLECPFEIDLRRHGAGAQDRKSTRLNSSHGYISYAVFCLKKKKSDTPQPTHAHRRPA